MKSIKMFGLAALAALMAMAFIGASSAMAENGLLCTADENPCSNANAVNSVHEVSVGKATLLSSALNVECNVLFSGTADPIREPSVETITGTFTYSNCNSGCVVTEENSPAELTVLKEGHETAKVTGEGLVHVNCGGILNCVYNGVGLVGSAKGPLLSAQTPDNGEVSLSEQTTNKESGAFCPKTGKLDIVTSPLEAVYITTALGYCVDTEHVSGFYTDATCTTKGAELKRIYRYMLIVGPAGLAAGEIKCYRQLELPHTGLWKNRTCTEDNASNVELYEKGEIKTVE